MTKEEILKIRPLYKEVISDSGRELESNEQSAPYLMLKVISTNLIEATKEEIDASKKYLEKHGSCKRHLVFDENTFMYYSRYCGICGDFIGFI